MVFNTRNEIVALFDLAADINETDNLVTAPAHSARIDRMRQIYEEIRHSARVLAHR
jgi:hypothetical protein